MPDSAPNVPPQEGMRVQTIEIIDRSPCFIVKEMGSTGTVTLVEKQLILAKMDTYIPGCEEWDNEIQLVDDEFGEYRGGVSITSMTDLFSYYFEPITTHEEEDEA